MPRLTGLTEVWSGKVEGHVVGLAFSPDGERLAAASIEGPIALFDSGGGAEIHRLAGHGLGTSAISWGGDGSHLASAGQDGKARAWDARAGVEVFAVEAGAAWAEHVAWSPAGAVLATAAGRKLRLWDGGGGLLREYPDQPATISAIAWKPRSAELASVAYGRLAIWSPEAPGPIRSFDRKGSMLALAWSPDARFLATGDQDATVQFWDVRTGDDLLMWGYRTKVRELSWDATGRYLATGGGPDATVWDCSGEGPEGTEPAQLGAASGGGGPVTALAFRPSGPILASAHDDGRLRIWRIQGRRGDRLASADLGAEVSAIAWHPSGRTLAAATATGEITVLVTPWN